MAVESIGESSIRISGGGKEGFGPQTGKQLQKL